MKDIFAKQSELNDYIFHKQGFMPFEEEISDEHGAAFWLENFRKAFSAEWAELMQEIIDNGTDTQNFKLEAIDILHFLVSLSLVTRVTPLAAVKKMTDLAELEALNERISLTEIVFMVLDSLQNSVKWKWWAQGGTIFDARKAYYGVADLWSIFGAILNIAGMTFADAKALYFKKNAVNFKRQDEGYDEDTKTEDDNQLG